MRRTLPYVLALLFGVAACGPTDVVVTMEIEVDDPAGAGTVTQPLTDIEVRVLPYDRDAIFDSLANAYPEPEPEIPEELEAARSEVQAAEAEWNDAQQRWGVLRDTLQKITDTLDGLPRTDAQYVVLFQEYNDFDAEYQRVEGEVDDAFARFDSLQQGTLRASDSVRILQDNWADEAFADVAEVFRQKQLETGLDVVVDTTDANGVARNIAVRPGQYWVNARYELTYTELYWNVPLSVEGGDPVQVRLDRSNAEERPLL
ncbi:MAG: hypothetical protein PVJ80_14280 [Gemmatimonadota bacterium]|jgi:hypothetical protein